jgi:hypothetical protein
MWLFRFAVPVPSPEIPDGFLMMVHAFKSLGPSPQVTAAGKARKTNYIEGYAHLKSCEVATSATSLKMRVPASTGNSSRLG